MPQRYYLKTVALSYPHSHCTSEIRPCVTTKSKHFHDLAIHKVSSAPEHSDLHRLTFLSFQSKHFNFNKSGFLQNLEIQMNKKLFRQKKWKGLLGSKHPVLVHIKSKFWWYFSTSKYDLPKTLLIFLKNGIFLLASKTASQMHSRHLPS